MKKVHYRFVLIIGMFLVGLPLIGQCSWEDEVCKENLQCKDASKNYTVPYCVSGSIDYAESCNFSSVANSLSFYLDRKDFNTKDMISQYCGALLGSQDCTASLGGQDGCQNCGRIYFSKPNSEGNRDWSQTFDSHQSLFVYLLCSSLSTGNVRGSDAFPKVLKGDVVKLLKLQQRSNGKDKCSLKDSPTLDDCDMSIYATEIFSAIMSDIFKIKYAQIFHVDSVESFQKDKKKRVGAFLSGYFGMKDEKKVIKDFPDTVDVIDSNQQYYKSVLKSLKLLDNSKLAKMAENLKCPVDGDIVGVDFIACALHGSQGKGSSLDPAFLTLFYNELLSYRIFVSYHSNRIQGKINNKGITTEEIEEKRRPKDGDLDFYSDLQIRAATQALQDFEELDNTYPLHIGLLLYQEKIREFRNKYLPPVVKQFYSLSEKLQNVQLPE